MKTGSFKMQYPDLTRTVIGTDYLQTKAKGKKQPPIDCYLDFINKLKELKRRGEYPAHWYDKEIEAIKVILTIETRGLV